MGDNKRWRFTKREFVKAVDNLINTRIYEIMNADEKEYKHYHKTYEVLLDNINTYEATKYKYRMTKKDRIWALKNILYKDTVDWCKFSMNRDKDVKDLILRVLIWKVYGVNLCSLLMEENNPNIPHMVWKDISFILGDGFSFEEWNNKHVNAYYDLVFKSEGKHDVTVPEETKELFKNKKLNRAKFKKVFFDHIGLVIISFDKSDYYEKEKEEDLLYSTFSI